DQGHEWRRNRTVDLDLNVAGGLVLLDGGAGFVFGVHQHVGGRGILAAAIHYAGQDDAGTDSVAFIHLALPAEETVHIVAEVANTRDAAGDVQDALIRREVGVHIEKAGQQRLAGAINEFGSGRRRASTIGTHRLDARAVHHYHLVVAYGRVLGVE